MTYPPNMNAPTINRCPVTERDIDDRQCEWSAVRAIAAQIDAERRFGVWPPSRPMPLDSPPPERGIGLGGILLVAAVGLVLFGAIVALAMAQFYF